MPSGDIVKSKAPSRWMAVFLVALLIGAVVVALFWSETSNATEAASLAWSPTDLKCEMVRVWPLPADCVFVFGK
ncbi:MAG TPA: hypothetical protein VEP93_12210 [Variovorax sp.]|nr:hypothetical protein [Variovorax sp.]